MALFYVRIVIAARSAYAQLKREVCVAHVANDATVLLVIPDADQPDKPTNATGSKAPLPADPFPWRQSSIRSKPIGNLLTIQLARIPLSSPVAEASASSALWLCFIIGLTFSIRIAISPQGVRQRTRTLTEQRPHLAHGFRGAYGRLSPLTAPTSLVGKVCSGST